MSGIPSYGKILVLGSAYTENALVGEVIVQEKVDGSQFRFGVTEEGELKVGTKGTIIGHPEENQMFKAGAEYILSKDLVKILGPNTFVYGEYLQKCKHNVLCYDRVPKNHIVIFDCVQNGRFLERAELEVIAKKLNVDLIPELYRGMEVRNG